jgi:hypothetical protein
VTQPARSARLASHAAQRIVTEDAVALGGMAAVLDLLEELAPAVRAET